MDNLFTTVVGSWPLTNNEENLVKIFNDLVQIGVDYPCYPQLTSMISQFLSPLAKKIPQLEESENRFFLNDDFKIPKSTIGLQYGEFIKTFFMERPYLLGKIKGTKACLTGPFTLASEIILKGEITKGIKPRVFTEPRGIMIEWIVDKLAEIIKQIASAYSDMGIDIISCDEPILGFLIGRKTLFHSEDFFIDILNKSTSEIKSLSSIHVCGGISPKCRDLLLQTDIKILDHEFVTNEDNFQVYRKEHFEKSGKLLALGTVKSKFLPANGLNVNDYVERVAFLKNYIKNAIDQYGSENLIIKPDCGFLPLKDSFGEKDGYEIAIRKVKNMVLALNNL